MNESLSIRTEIQREKERQTLKTLIAYLTLSIDINNSMSVLFACLISFTKLNLNELCYNFNYTVQKRSSIDDHVCDLARASSFILIPFT